MSPSRSASSIARPPHSVAPGSSSASIRSCGQVAVGHRELGAGRERLEQRDRLSASRLGGRASPGEPRQRESQRCASPSRAVAGRRMLERRSGGRRSRPRSGRSGSTRTSAARAAPRARSERSRSAARGRTARPPRGARRARPRARRRPARSGAPPRRRRPPPRGGRAGRGRAPAAAASAASARRCSARRRCGGSASSTASRAISWRNAIASRVGAQHPGRQARVERVGGVRLERLEQPQLGRVRDDRDGVEQRARRGLPAARPRASTASRTVAGRSAPPAASTSVTKNGLPPVRRCSASGSRPSGGELRHRCRRQRRRRDAVGDALGSSPSTMRSGWRSVELVVAVGGDHERGQRLDPARQQPEDVERRLVGPVQVLQHDDRGSSEFGRERGGQRARRRALGHERGELAARLLGDVDERAERARCVQRVAGAPQDPRGRPSQNVRTSAVLPIPASPATSTNRPRLCSRTASWRASSSSSCAARSRSVTGTILAGTSQPRKRAAYSPASPVSSKCPRRARRRICARVNAVDERGAARAAAARSRACPGASSRGRARAGRARRATSVRAASSTRSTGTAPSSGTPAARRALVDLRADVAGVDGGDRDAVALLEPQHVGVGDDAALGERVGGRERDGHVREPGRDVDHAPARVAQGGQCGRGHAPRARRG